MSVSSASVGFCPRDLMTVPSSLVVMVPRVKSNTSYVGTGRVSRLCQICQHIIDKTKLICIPSPSLSNKLKASLNSATCSSVNPRDE